MYENMEMRAVFAQELAQLMRENENICCLDADLAKANGTIGLRKDFPDRAFDVGIAEQNMASVAAGLASYGFIPFIGSFTAFASRRICDQLTISVAYARQNVKIVGTDPGISAELNGGTHMSFEDMAVLRSIPGMVLFEPTDAVQLAKALPQIVEHDGPVYIRMFRKVAPEVFPEDYAFDLMKADKLREGKDVSIFASGIMVSRALEAAAQLEAQGIEADVINVHTWKPLDVEAVLASVQKTGCAVVCENHNSVGGLFAAVSEVLAAHHPAPAEAVGIQDHFGEVGKMDFLTEKYHLAASDITTAARKAINRKQ